MNRPPTIALLASIIAAGLAGNFWLHSERAIMARTEASLRDRAAKGEATEKAVSPPASKVAEREKTPPRDAAAFVRTLKELDERDRKGEIDGHAYSKATTLADYAGASRDDLLALAEELKGSGLHPGMIRQMRLKIANHLAKIDPRAGTLLALEEGAGRDFEISFSAWMATDAKGALAWMDAEEPPLGLSRFKEIDQLDLDDLRLVARLAVDPAGAALPPLPTKDVFPRAYSKMPATLPPSGMVVVLGRLKAAAANRPEFTRLAMALAADYPDPRISLQILADAGLEKSQLTEVAAAVIAWQDPPGARRGIEWYREAFPGEAHAAGFREIVSTWAKADRSTAIGWIEALADPAEKARLRDALPSIPKP